MRYIIILICLLGIIDLHAQIGPQVQVADPSIDHGIINEGDSVSHTFQFTNSGDATLTINEVEVTCACITTNLSETSVAPGNSATITVWFDTEGKMGRQHKIVTLKTNATVPVTRLSIMGEIVPSD